MSLLDEEAKNACISNTNSFGIDGQNIDAMNQINKKRRNHGNISEDNTEYILHNKHLKDDYFTGYKESVQKSTQVAPLKLGLSAIEKNCSTSMVILLLIWVKGRFANRYWIRF